MWGKPYQEVLLILTRPLGTSLKVLGLAHKAQAKRGSGGQCACSFTLQFTDILKPIPVFCLVFLRSLVLVVLGLFFFFFFGMK